MTDQLLRIRITTRQSAPIPPRVAEVLDAFDRHGSIGRTFAKIVRKALTESTEAAQSFASHADPDSVFADIESEFARWMCAPDTHAEMGGICEHCARRLSIIAKLQVVATDHARLVEERSAAHLDADRATLSVIPEPYRVAPTCEEPSAYRIAVGASVGAMLTAIALPRRVAFRIAKEAATRAYERAQIDAVDEKPLAERIEAARVELNGIVDKHLGAAAPVTEPASVAELREAAEACVDPEIVSRDPAHARLSAALADLPGAVREREERERAIAKEGYRQGHYGLVGLDVLPDRVADEIIASVRGRT